MNPEMYQELVRQINSLQKQVDGLVKPEVGRWLDWTPTVNQNGNITLTISYARYKLEQKTVSLIAKVTLTSAGTAGNIISMGNLPFTIKNTGSEIYDVIGNFAYLDNGTSNYIGICFAVSATGIAFVAASTTSFLGISPNFAVANGDKLGLSVIYETA